MLAELARQDQIASDLANASTPGYKPERSVQRAFGEYLLENSRTGDAVGALGLGSEIAETRTDFSQGPLRETSDPLDVALAGPGFLAVRTPAGDRYTRNGQLGVDAQGRLVTSTGLPVLDERGQPIEVGAGTPQIAADGAVSVNGRQVARLAVVELRNPVKEGDSLFAGTPGGRPQETAVRQGFIESSSIDPARAMIDMIVSMRSFESTQRVIRTIDETLGRGINGSQTG